MKPSNSLKHLSKIRIAAANLATPFAQLVPHWRWKIDGVATAIVLTVLVLNKTSIKATAFGPWMNVVAIFSLGIVLSRNLRAKKKANTGLPGKVASLWNRRRG